MTVGNVKGLGMPQEKPDAVELEWPPERHTRYRTDGYEAEADAEEH